MEKDYLIEKWLKDDLSADEMRAFEALPEANSYKKILENAAHFKASHHSKVPSFESLSHKLKNDTPVRKLNWLKPMMQMAGVAVVAIGIYFLFFSSNLTYVKTAASEKNMVTLPDASTVMLNAMSEISYSESSWEKDRLINLEGEAFFKVAKGATFSVNTSEGIVTVLGTEFNVKQRGNFFDVQCFEGRVRVETPQATKILLAGDTFRIHGDLVSYRATNHQQPLWTNNVSDFNAVPFREVISEMERQYNIKISYDDKIGNQLFSGSFVQDNLENALKSISKPLNLTYTIETSKTVVLTNNEE